MERAVKTTKLEKKVHRVITYNLFYKRMLKIERLFWRSKNVSIDTRLLETLPPEEIHSEFGKVRHSEEEYANIVNQWRILFIGGHTQKTVYREGKYWHPPLGSCLYRVYQEKVPGVCQSHQDSNEYFLLDFGDKYFFLKRTFGIENKLYVITGTKEFSQILKNILAELG